MDRGDTQCAKFRAPRFGDVDTSHRGRFAVQVEGSNQLKTMLRGDGTDPIDPGGLLAHVVLSHPSNRDQLGCPAGQQQFLETTDTRVVTTKRGLVDPLLESENLRFQEE